MARKPEIQYIRYYVDGSAARQLEPEIVKKKKPARKKKPAVLQKIYIDPLPVAGILLSCVLLVCMIAGLVQLNQVRQEQQALRAHVRTLQEGNADLEKKYREDVDLENVEKMALALGMVPQEQVQHITVQLPQEEPAQEGFWQSIVHFLAGLFA